MKKIHCNKKSTAAVNITQILFHRNKKREECLAGKTIKRRCSPTPVTLNTNEQGERTLTRFRNEEDSPRPKTSAEERYQGFRH